MSSIGKYLRAAACLEQGMTLTDGQLLDRFVATRDERAFGILLRRHGPMVLGVCRRVLRSEADAEDAFQAAFLVLLRKAGSISAPDRLANWLYGVAYNSARKAKAMVEKRHAREKQVAVMPEYFVQLPDKYRIEFGHEGEADMDVHIILGGGNGIQRWRKHADGRVDVL